MVNRCVAVIIGQLVLVSLARAGGGPQNVLLVVNDNSQRSLAIGQYYGARRQLHGRQVLHITTTTNPTISTASFSNEVRNPVQDYLAQSGLSNQVDYVVFGPDLPYRVEHTNGHQNGITSAMFYDFKDYTLSGPCPQLGDAESSYYESEMAFSGNTTGYLATVLTAWDADQARRLVDRSVRADGTTPTSTVHYVHMAENIRAIRWPRFENAAFSIKLSGGALNADIRRTSLITGETNVMGYMVGRVWVPLSLNHYQEGALGDHLTSFGGYLTDPAGQMSILDWIGAGMSGSYGTVVEPCAFTNKFPDARLYYWYGRGFNMAESYWMSVQHPYQGVFVGDPLCAPYAQPPVVAVSGLANGDVVSDSVSITITGQPWSVSGRVQRLDVYIDDLYTANPTNCAPVPGDVVVLNMGSTSATYAVQMADTLLDVTRGLQDAVNAMPALAITADAFGDRLVLIQDNIGVPATGITYSAYISTTNATPSLSADTVSSHFIETCYPPRQRLVVSGIVNPGDEVRLVVTNLDGESVTNTVTASGSNTLATLLGTLTNLVNQHASLSEATGCSLGLLKDTENPDEMDFYLFARTNTWEGANLDVTLSSTGLTGSYAGPVASNARDITGRGTVYLSVGEPVLAANYTLDTSTLADGPHELLAMAYDGSAVQVQGHTVIPFIVSNHTLACTIAEPQPPASLWLGDTGAVSIAATHADGSVTSVSLYVEGKLYGTTSAPPYMFSWSTVDYGAGSVVLQATAKGSGGERALSESRRVTVFDDVDSDGMPNSWEYSHFGGETNAHAAADSDGDGADDLSEFMADTLPLDSNSLFRIAGFVPGTTEPTLELTHPSSTNRRYIAQHNDSDTLDASGWSSMGPGAQPGAPGTSTWFLVASTNQAAYRIQVQGP